MDAIAQFFVEWGYVGLFLSAFIAGSILPFSSEAVMVILTGMGLDPVGCLIAASLGNTLGGMTCYWIGSLGRPEWITRIGITPRQLARARKFLAGRGALMGFFAFLPLLGSAITIVLGLTRANIPISILSITIGKVLRYVLLVYGLSFIV